MKNIFSQTKEYVKPPKRNVFDLSFMNHGTYNFGTLYPVFCKETIPGDSFKIDPTFALRFLPTVFPVQTKITANLHFFYVRNRILWDNWKKFYTHTDDVQFPYIDTDSSKFATGSLADYLNVPTTLVGDYGNGFISFVPNEFYNFGEEDGFFAYRCPESLPPRLGFRFISDNNDEGDKPHYCITNTFSSSQLGEGFTNLWRFKCVTKVDGYNCNTENYYLFFRSADSNDAIAKARVHFDVKNFSESLQYVDLVFDVYFAPNGNTNWQVINETTFLSLVSEGNARYFCLVSPITTPTSPSIIPEFQGDDFIFGSSYLDSIEIGRLVKSDYIDLGVNGSRNPFIDHRLFPTGYDGIPIRLSALPFRAYECIYNAFYRNELNDPLIINGKPEYEVYVPNRDDGADSYDYKLYNRNWELDYLTSAVQSPQQGIAPLVGVSQQGDFTFVHKDSDGNIGYFTAKANVSADGSSITGFQLSDRVELDGIPSNPVDASNVPDSVKRGTIYGLNQMALAGISINDFRNVNALQRWLEANIRRGYKYKDVVKSHFGVDIDERLLNMPEFIGGISTPVYSNQVNQTSETETDPLGSYAGQLSVIAKSNHSIKQYCDEPGFIIGILSIVPVPNYSQLLPKHFLKHNYLDYYFPEFAHIGMQPIDYREVCPVQQYSADKNGLTNTFGYQRAHYDYIQSVDEVHGLFRTNLRNFVLNRQFDTLPRLNKSFLQVDADQLNDIFSVKNTISDKILGQINFDCIVKRPIPRIGIPRLE